MKANPFDAYHVLTPPPLLRTAWLANLGQTFRGTLPTLDHQLWPDNVMETDFLSSGGTEDPFALWGDGGNQDFTPFENYLANTPPKAHIVSYAAAVNPAITIDPQLLFNFTPLPEKQSSHESETVSSTTGYSSSPTSSPVGSEESQPPAKKGRKTKKASSGTLILRAYIDLLL